MKKLIVLATLAWSMTMVAQTSTQSTTEKKLVINESTKTIDLDATEQSVSYKDTGYTATWKGNSYPVYVSSKGKKFIFMVSKKSGKQYRKYID